MSELVNKSEVLDIWNNYWITDMTTLDAENQLRELATVELKSAPQLNENQQIVLDYLKGIAVKNDNAPIVTFSAFGYQHFGAELPTDVEKAYQSMNGKQDLVVMSAYVNWALEQEEE